MKLIWFPPNYREICDFSSSLCHDRESCDEMVTAPALLGHSVRSLSKELVLLGLCWTQPLSEATGQSFQCQTCGISVIYRYVLFICLQRFIYILFDMFTAHEAHAYCFPAISSTILTDMWTNTVFG